MKEIELLGKAIGEAVADAVVKVFKEAMENKIEQLEKVEKSAKQRSSKNNESGVSILKIRNTMFKFKPSGYNNGSKLLVIDHNGKKGKVSIPKALTPEEAKALIEFIASNFGFKIKFENDNSKSYSKKNYSKKSYGSKKSYKGYRKGKQAEEELEVEEASYDQALE